MTGFYRLTEAEQELFAQNRLKMGWHIISRGYVDSDNVLRKRNVWLTPDNEIVDDGIMPEHYRYWLAD